MNSFTYFLTSIEDIIRQELKSKQEDGLLWAIYLRYLVAEGKSSMVSLFD